MTTFRAWSAGWLTPLILLPCLLPIGWLVALFALGASRRAHVALAVTTVLVAVLTAIAYLPMMGAGSSCMGGMILLACVPLSVCYPIFFGLCWFFSRPGPSPDFSGPRPPSAAPAAEA